MWKPRRLTILWASTACYKDKFTLTPSPFSATETTNPTQLTLAVSRSNFVYAWGRFIRLFVLWLHSDVLRDNSYMICMISKRQFGPCHSWGRYSLTAPGFEPRSGYVGCVVDKVALGRGFLRLLTILVPENAPYSSVIWGWYNRPISGRSTKWTQSHPTPRNKIIKQYQCLNSFSYSGISYRLRYRPQQYGLSLLIALGLIGML
jgi:hypothetical protein